ncbi:MAG: response regulator transcription factor [Bacteroidaceae bacterium]|nr:response regulator transcription factor [Bacteroidaceae bacterium]
MGKAKILIVDDDMLLGNIMTQALTDEDYEVHFQNSLTSIHKTAKDFNPDLILLDIAVGKFDGIEQIPLIRAVLPKTPILIISSHIERSEKQRAFAMGAVAFLSKPFEVDDLLSYTERYATPEQTIDCSIPIGKFRLNAENRELKFNGFVIRRLTKTEFAILLMLYSKRNEEVTHKELESIWDSTVMNYHSLYNYIAKLRELISKDQSLIIETTEQGYRLRI